MHTVQLDIGLKTDPVEYRYSFDWLFQLLQSEDIHHVQLGSFFEAYSLPDRYFLNMRQQAADCGVTIDSLFTAHRELGGFLQNAEDVWAIARASYERWIEIGALLGAQAVGSNPGAVLRDRMDTKADGIRRYLDHMRELIGYAANVGIPWLTMEPMSCLAEPPTLPNEITSMCEELRAAHRAAPATTADVGTCTDVAHGYVSADGTVVHDHMALLDANIPYLYELHLKNTDAQYGSTFGFSQPDQKRGVVSLEKVRDQLLERSADLPVCNLIGYVETSGPKLGRDYSDSNLETEIRHSLRHARQAFATSHVDTSRANTTPKPVEGVLVSPSVMCADLCNVERSIRMLERAGADMLHFDLMDAHFTPNMPLGLAIIHQLRSKTDLPFDVHLMVEDNDLFVRELTSAGVQYISVHAETATHLDRTLTLIRDSGAKAGVALNPATTLTALDYVADRIDFALIMTVNPGFAGQALVPSSIRKIRECRAVLDRLRPGIAIEVDGNVSFKHIPAMVAAGADMLVAGTSSVFHSSGTIAANMARTRQSISEGLAARSGGTKQ